MLILRLFNKSYKFVLRKLLDANDALEERYRTGTGGVLRCGIKPK